MMQPVQSVTDQLVRHELTSVRMPEPAALQTEKYQVDVHSVAVQDHSKSAQSVWWRHTVAKTAKLVIGLSTSAVAEGQQ